MEFTRNIFLGKIHKKESAILAKILSQKCDICAVKPYLSGFREYVSQGDNLPNGNMPIVRIGPIQYG